MKNENNITFFDGDDWQSGGEDCGEVDEVEVEKWKEGVGKGSGEVASWKFESFLWRGRKA